MESLSLFDTTSLKMTSTSNAKEATKINKDFKKKNIITLDVKMLIFINEKNKYTNATMWFVMFDWGWTTLYLIFTIPLINMLQVQNIA